MRTKGWIAAVTLLVVALFVLIHLQLYWIGELTRAQQRRERSVLEFAARQVAVDLEHDVHRSAMAFQGASPPELDERLAQWRASARDPHLIGALYIAHGDALIRVDGEQRTPVRWPAELTPIHDALQHDAVRFASPFFSEVPALVLPLRPMPGPSEIHLRRRMPAPEHEHEMPMMRMGPPALIVEYDRAYLARTYFPDLVHRLGEPYDVLVTDGVRPVYSNAQWDGSKPDATVKFLRFFREDEDSRGWTVFLRRRGARIEDVLAHVRLHNLLLSGSVLVLLIASFVILTTIAHRAERMRVQQLELVAGLTHELNTPITAIRSAGQNLADGVVTEREHVARYGAIVNREATRLADLVAQVLDYSGLQSRVITNRAPVDIAEIVSAAIDQTRWLADEKSVTIEQHVAGDLPHVEGDADALTRALQNLVANAIRHGGDGKWVAVRAERDDDGVAITIEDHGSGIAARDVKRLFEPFYRGTNAKARGTGLGLTIVRQIARAHGGSVSVDANRERGAAFTLRIPAVQRG
jgi:signal transduction histidine kinase